MDGQGNSRHGGALELLEHVLADESAEPTHLPLSLLENITKGFSIGHQIGTGGFAVVYKGIVGKGMVAVKKLTKTYDMPESEFHKEIECLMKAKHKNVVRILGYCDDTQGIMANYQGKPVMAGRRNWLLCLEYVPNGSLENYITGVSSGLDWKRRYGIIKGICKGLHYLHENYILHLDLKPANILLDRHLVPKISDFGLSRCLAEGQTPATTKHIRGTPGYLAPELYTGKITFASDIYSLGVLIMEILAGVKQHAEDENLVESWMNRLEASEGNTQLEQVKVCIGLGIQCLEADPKKRPSARSIIDRLEQTASTHSSDDDIPSSSTSSSIELRIESRNNGLEMQSVNNKGLVEELEKLLERLRVPQEFAASLTRGSFEESRMLKNVEACEWLTGAIRRLEVPNLDLSYVNMRAVSYLRYIVVSVISTFICS